MPFLQKQHKFSCVYTGVFPASCTPRPTKGDIVGDTVALNEDQNNVFMPPWHLAHTAPHIQTNTNNPLSPKSANYAPREMLWEPKWLDTERHMTSLGPTLTRCKHPGGQSGHPSILPQKSVAITRQETRKECHSWIWPRHPWIFDIRLNNGADIWSDLRQLWTWRDTGDASGFLDGIRVL